MGEVYVPVLISCSSKPFFFKDRWAKEGTTVNVGDVDDSRVWMSVGSSGSKGR